MIYEAKKQKVLSHKNRFIILLKLMKFRLLLHFPDQFGSNRDSVFRKINRKSAII